MGAVVTALTTCPVPTLLPEVWGRKAKPHRRADEAVGPPPYVEHVPSCPALVTQTRPQEQRQCGLGWVPSSDSNQVFLVVCFFLINILNRNYGLVAGNTEVNISINRLSRAGNQKQGKETARGRPWVPGTVHSQQRAGAPIPFMAPTLPAKPQTIQKQLRHSRRTHPKLLHQRKLLSAVWRISLLPRILLYGSNSQPRLQTPVTWGA